jgi:hypothetical protein
MMSKGPFAPLQFTPTQCSSAADKAEFGNTLLRFLDAGCPQELFTNKLYRRLSMSFGHIAHYDRSSFYDTWFTRARHRAAFVEKTLRWPCHGDPEFTFSDAEYAIQQVMRQRNYLARFELKAAEALRTAELRDLERLEAKYRAGQPPKCAGISNEAVPVENPDPVAPSSDVPVQISLF